MTIDQLNAHYGLSSKNIMDYLADLAIDTVVPTLLKECGKGIVHGDSISYQISRKMVEDAYEDGPLAAALTDPYGDGCLIN